MNTDAFANICRDGTAVDILQDIRASRRQFALVHRALSAIQSDEKCAEVMRYAGRLDPYGMFCLRTFAFYIKYKATLFPGAELGHNTLQHILDESMLVDAAAKVEHILALCTKPNWEFPFETIVSSGLRHWEAGVRCQFLGCSPLVSVFLVGVPPRVQCRVLCSMRTVCEP